MSNSTATPKKSPLSIAPAPALCQMQKPSLDRIDALDLVNTRHHQVQGILASIFMSLDSTDPTQKTLKNAIWAAQDMLEQAEDAAALLVTMTD
jgi:hypothetical protein